MNTTTQSPLPLDLQEPGQNEAVTHVRPRTAPIQKRGVAHDAALFARDFALAYPKGTAISVALIAGILGIAVMGRPEPTPVTQGAISLGEVEQQAPSEQDRNQVLALQAIAGRDAAMSATVATVTQQIGNAASSRSRDYLTFATSVYQKELQVARSKGRPPLYRDAGDILRGMLLDKADQVKALATMGNTVEANAALMESLSIIGAINLHGNPGAAQPIAVNLTVSPGDESLQPQFLLAAQSIQSYRDSLAATNQTLDAYSASIAQERRQLLQGQRSAPVTTTPTSYQGTGQP